MDYTVVFDVNVWIDAADYLCHAGTFPEELGGGGINPHRNAALAAAWLLSPAEGVSSIQLCWDTSLLGVAMHKLMQPRPFGLEWTRHQVKIWLVDSLLGTLQDSGNTHKVDPAAIGEALDGVDHEDQRVYGLFKKAMGWDPVRTPLLVTADGAFRDAVNEDAGPFNWAMSPGRFCDMMAGVHVSKPNPWDK